MTTVADPGPAEIFHREVLRGGSRYKGTKGFGSFNESRALHQADCRTGPVVFMVEQRDDVESGGHRLTRDLMAGYVAAEAERVGCGPEKVTLPDA
ncbi:hypothetical protein ACFXKG_14835 [Streptomyces sp. NPDC059255]|uniref:hypothetical protein n=1 Tax=Streptomyces sp. NPDC059255 TaxID=3346793 RepID=UPI0036B9FA3C